MLVVENVLGPVELASCREVVRALAFEGGAASAGKTARLVKRNTQAVLGTATGARLKSQLLSAMAEHPVVQAYARTKRFADPRLSRMQAGDEYGLHTDNAVMRAGGEQVRSDLSFTLFLTDPDAYEGGELLIEHPLRTEEFKLSAGSAIIYPSTFLHRVAPVRSGERLVFVGWVESLIRQEAHRDLLFDMANLKAQLRSRHDPLSIEMLTVAKIEQNLLRLWAE